MKHIYHVQEQVVKYYQHIPYTPKDVTISQDLLFGIQRHQFIEAFQQFTELMRNMYRDMEKKPEEYGLLIIDINQVNENKEEGNLAKASWRSIKRLGDMMLEIGRLGELINGALKIRIVPFKTAVKKINMVHLLLNRLIDFGFALGGYNDNKFVKNEEFFTVSYPESPFVMNAVKAYAVSEPFHNDDPHEFYYFDYKRIADRKKLPTHCVATDLAALITEDSGKLLVEIHKYFVDELKLTPHYKDDSIEYYLKKKRVARFIIDFLTLNVVFILKLKDVDRYIDLVAGLPKNLRSYFEKNSCNHCGFQGATNEFCKFRVLWILDNIKHEACNFGCFNFKNPESKDAKIFGQLMAAEYKIKII